MKNRQSFTSHWVCLLVACAMLAFVACDKGHAIAEDATADKGTADKGTAGKGTVDEVASAITEEDSQQLSDNGSTPDAAAQSQQDDATRQDQQQQGDAQPDPEHPFPDATAAPELVEGVDWLNTAGPLELRSLRGKFVVLDFWTYCCINCIHVLPELKKLEEAYPNEVVVIGVHSAKFDTEQNTDNIKEAILRYEIKHPVVNDARHAIWNRYAVNSWPSLRIIDPEGKLIAGDSGEIPFEVLDGFFKEFIPYYEQRGLMDKTPLRFDLEEFTAAATPLRFPGKVLADEASRRLFIADSNHNRIVVTTLDGELITTIGSGKIGAADGNFATAEFDHPQGMALLGNVLYVADTENHNIRKVDLEAETVATIAGTGEQARSPWPGFDPTAQTARFVGNPGITGLNSPWDLLIHDDGLYIAMAGPHQIWRMALDETEIGPYAGNGREDIVDGGLLPDQPYAKDNGGVEGELVTYSSFAQPSGLATDGTWLYVADSEGSSIRAVPFDPSEQVTTPVGTADLPFGRLFEFGDVDGEGKDVRLQHCLGVAFAEGKLFVADTYNNKIKEFNLASGVMRTLAGDGEPGDADAPPRFDEPAGISIAGDRLFVADTNNHHIRVVNLAEGSVSTLNIQELQPPDLDEPVSDPFAGADVIDAGASTVRANDGRVTLRVKLELPAGWKINEAAPMQWRVDAAGDSGAVDRTAVGQLTTVEQPAAEVPIVLPLAGDATTDALRVSLVYYYCQEGNEGLCKVGTVTWNFEMAVSDDAGAEDIVLVKTVDE